LPFSFTSFATTSPWRRAMRGSKVAATAIGTGSAVDSPWRGPTGPSL
jgi:hypothetical protein